MGPKLPESGDQQKEVYLPGTNPNQLEIPPHHLEDVSPQDIAGMLGLDSQPIKSVQIDESSGDRTYRDSKNQLVYATTENDNFPKLESIPGFQRETYESGESRDSFTMPDGQQVMVTTEPGGKPVVRKLQDHKYVQVTDAQEQKKILQQEEKHAKALKHASDEAQKWELRDLMNKSNV